MAHTVPQKITFFAFLTLFATSHISGFCCSKNAVEEQPKNITMREFKKAMRSIAIQKKLDETLLHVAETSRMDPKQKYNALSTLLDNKASVFSTREDGAHALHLLIETAGYYKRDDLKSIQLLLDHKSPLSHFNKGPSLIEKTCLGVAITYNQHPVIKMLVQAKADVNQSHMSSLPPLHQVASEKTISDEDSCTIFKTIANGISCLDRVSSDGSYPFAPYRSIHFARTYNKPKLTALLLSYGARPDCPCDENCQLLDDLSMQTAHEKWKAVAKQNLVAGIPVQPLVETVMKYCFGDPRQKE